MNLGEGGVKRVSVKTSGWGRCWQGLVAKGVGLKIILEKPGNDKL